MNDDIKKALETIKANQPHRQTYIDYYDGAHPLAFATDKFKTAFGQTLKHMRDNLCPIVVDAVADRMEVINFAGDDEGKTSAEGAWKLWQRERMELGSNDTHVEALKTGCAYVIVWPDAQTTAKFYLQDSRNCVVIEDEETAEQLFGAKLWETAEKFIRLTLYYPDRIEKYISIKKRNEGSGDIKPAHFKPMDGDEQPVEDNPYGIIPMFKFECNPVLSDAMPIQDALNKTVCDMLVAQEFAAFPQRWATGLEPTPNEVSGIPTEAFKGGANKMFFASAENVKFGQFDAANMEAFIHVSDSFRLEMARVSGTPLHFFAINVSDAISGKALKTLESRFTKKVTRLCINFGSVWAQAMSLALAIESQSTGNLTVQWEPAEERDEKEMLEAAVIKQDLGIPDEVLQEEIGYTKEDIARFKTLAEAEPDIDPAVKMAKEFVNAK